jgi:hypothetical protein
MFARANPIKIGPSPAIGGFVQRENDWAVFSVKGGVFITSICRMDNSTASAPSLSIALEPPDGAAETTAHLDYAPALTATHVLKRTWTIARAIAWHLAPFIVLYTYFWFGYQFLLSHRYQINPDGVGYISVAQKYAAGQFFDAVNEYWSPLY